MSSEQLNFCIEGSLHLDQFSVCLSTFTLELLDGSLLSFLELTPLLTESGDLLLNDSVVGLSLLLALLELRVLLLVVLLNFDKLLFLSLLDLNLLLVEFNLLSEALLLRLDLLLDRVCHRVCAASLLANLRVHQLGLFVDFLEQVRVLLF